MRFRLLVLVLLLVRAPAIHAAEYLELTDFQLVDGSGAPARPVKQLVARDGVIVMIDGQGEAPKPEADARWVRIGLNGAWVMPGLVANSLGRAPRGGVTAVRDLAGDARR